MPHVSICTSNMTQIEFPSHPIDATANPCRDLLLPVNHSDMTAIKCSLKTHSFDEACVNLHPAQLVAIG